MTIDTEARRLAALTRQTTAGSFDVEAGLSSLRQTARRRGRLRVAGALVAVASLIVGISLVVRDPAQIPPPAPGGTPSQHLTPGLPGCGGAPRAVRCLGPRTFAIDAPGLSYVVDLPEGFSTQPDLDRAPYAIDVYQDASGSRAGIAILIGVHPTGPGSGRPDANGLAEFVRSRPFLETSEPRRTTISGFPGWRVETQWAPGVKQPRLSTSCNHSQPDCRPVLAQQRPDRSWEIGVWRSMVGSFTFIDLPDGQVAVLWSWAFDANTEALSANDRLIEAITLEAR